jgi:hypothetical protein
MQFLDHVFLVELEEDLRVDFGAGSHVLQQDLFKVLEDQVALLADRWLRQQSGGVCLALEEE